MLKNNNIKIASQSDWKKVKRTTENYASLQSQLFPLTKQKPNKAILRFKLFGKNANIIRFNLSVYNMFYPSKRKLKAAVPGVNNPLLAVIIYDSTHTVRRWFMNNIGEEPVVYDSAQVTETAIQLTKFLSNKGYFDSKVTYTTKFKGKKATVFYTVNTGSLYTIDSVTFPKPVGPVTLVIDSNRNNSLLKKGDPVDLDKLQSESGRITHDLLNDGYYMFNNDKIYFELDTTKRDKHALINIRVATPVDSNEHKQFHISNIFVYPDYASQNEADKTAIDTLKVKGDYFIYRKMILRPDVLSSVIFMSPNQTYSRTKYDYTLSRISDLGVFKFVSIRFKQKLFDSLDCYIYLTPAKKNEVSAELEASNIEDNLGSSIKLSYKNRNLFHKADLFEVDLTGGVQIPIYNTDSLIYNAGASLNYYLPGAWPFKFKKALPKTKVTLSSNVIQQTKVFSLVNYNFSYGFDIKGKKKRHLWNPFFVTLINSFNISKSFQERLDTDRILAQSFDKLLIVGANYTLIYTNQVVGKAKNYFYFRGGAEVAGWEVPVDLISNVFKKNPSNDGTYKIGSLPFSNYVRVDADYRYNWALGLGRSFVARIYGGLGVPLGSQSVLPFIKQFYAGGPSDIRAWRIRALGPGSYDLKTNTAGFYDQTGDIKLEGNLEYRFPLIGFLKGAVFADAGNIWDLKPDPAVPGGDFQINRFYKEIAIGTGAGLRFDFSFLVARVDLGVPIHNPSTISTREEWTYNQPNFINWDWLKNNVVLNIAIGYPF